MQNLEQEAEKMIREHELDFLREYEMELRAKFGNDKYELTKRRVEEFLEYLRREKEE